MWRKAQKLWTTRINIDLNTLPPHETNRVTHIINEKPRSCPQLIHSWGQVQETQGWPLQRSSRLLLNPVSELSDLVVDRSALSHQLTDLAVGMHNRRMVTPAECLADLWQRELG